MGFFDDLKLKKDGNGNLKVTYNTKPFITVNIECIHSIINDYATKKFLNRIGKLKIEEEPENEQQFKDAEKLARIYSVKKKQYYNRPNIRPIDTKSREFNYFIDAVKLMLELESDFNTFIDAQIKGLEFAGVFPTPVQLANEGAEKRLLDYTSTMSKASKTKISNQDYELGSDRYRTLNRDYKANDEMEVHEVEFLIEYNRRNHNQVPNSLTEYLEELTNSANG